MTEDKLNLKFFPNTPCFNHVDKGIIYGFKIPHTVQLKDIVIYLDYTDLRQTMKTLDKIKKEPLEICDDFDELVERLMKYKNDYNYHPQVNNLSLFNRIEIRSDNLNCMIGFPMDKFVNNKISLDKILPLPPETITLNTEIRMFRNVDDYKCNDLYITVDNLYYNCDEPNFIKLTELEKYKKYPRGKVNNQELIKYKVNDGLVVLRKNTCINIELSAIFKEIHLVYKEHSSLEPKGCKNKIVADEEIKSFNNLKIYIDYKLTDITTLTELFDYIKQHKTVCFNIEFEDNKYEDYYIYYKAI